MKISESKSVKETKDSISKAFKHMVGLKHSDEDYKPFCQSKVQLVQHPFTDKLICLKDSYYLKLLHRDGIHNEFKFNAQTCFSEPPRTLESRVTLQIKQQMIPSFFKFMNWQSMFKENKDFPQYLGFVKKVFDDMSKKSKIVKSG